jgi:putative hydrolase of the HAD superfamily
MSHDLAATLGRIDTWVFDLDNTLYPASANLFPQIDVRMKAFIGDLLGLDPDNAFKLQKQYYREHGTTLRGLMLNHDVEPETFLEFVHDIDHSVLAPDDELDGLLGALPGRKLIHTNGSARHAAEVLNALGVMERFEAIFDISAGSYIPKPHPDSYKQFLTSHAFEPSTAIMFEDSVKNLAPAAELGMATVLVYHDSVADAEPWPEHCHFTTSDLKAWLRDALNAL